MSSTERLAHIKPHDLIEIIAEHARKFAAAAGVGGMETAGAVISYLADNPEDLEPFINGGCEEILASPGRAWLELGRLSWHARDGTIRHPAGSGPAPRSLRHAAEICAAELEATPAAS